MKKVALTLAVLSPLLMGISTAVAQEKTKLTGQEIEQTFSGNTTEVQFTVGSGLHITSWALRKPDGEMISMNSKGETGTAKWSVKGDELCTKWVRPYWEWRVSDTCSTVMKISDTKFEFENSGMRSNNATLLQGNPKNIQ